LFFACREDHIAPLNPLVKSLFCFKVGSTWTFYDTANNDTITMLVNNYTDFRSALETKKMRKSHDIAEGIRIDVMVKEFPIDGVLQEKKTEIAALIGQDNTAKGFCVTPLERSLSISCDANNLFSGTVTYLSNYTVNSITYRDVYVFQNHGYEYYVAKNIGFIHCKGGYKDLVLIDKTIYQ
jgi:hypothetical protein